MSIKSVSGIICSKAPEREPKVGILLGSGLGSFTDLVEDQIIISYDDLQGFPNTGVQGHTGQLVLGKVHEIEVAILQGRAHYYEKGSADAMRTPIHTLKELGCDLLILTNAAGSLVSEAQPGSIMLLTDHINFTGVSPLFSEIEPSRFVDMVDAYDPNLCDQLRKASLSKGITLHEGVYIWFCGPSFETPAEIKAAKKLGAAGVGMSTVPEVILARFFGLKVAALSIITNMAAGISNIALSHDQTIENAKYATHNLELLLGDFILNYENS